MTAVEPVAPAAVEPAPATAPAARSGLITRAAVRATPWLPLATVLVVVVGFLVKLNVAELDIARYAGYAGWAVLLPGVLVYRSLRRTPHSLADDLTMGAATGLVLELVAYTVFHAVGAYPAVGLWPLAVVVPFAAVPSLRRHWRPRGYRPAPPAWSWTVAAVALWLLGYLTQAYLKWNPPVPLGKPNLYFIDQLFLLSVTGEAKHHFPPQLPQVAGEPLTYHWFAFAHLATASQISGVDTPTVFFRLAPPAMCLLAVVLLAVVGWRVSGKPWVGAVAAALTFAVGELVVGSFDTGPLGSSTGFVVWNSQSVPYVWLLTFPLIALAADQLTGGLPDAPVGRGAWVLLAGFALAISGAKASVLPVATCAVGLVALVELVRRRPYRSTWLIAAIVVAAQVFALVVLFHFAPNGMRLRPLGIFYVHVPPHSGALIWAVALGSYAVYMLPRLAGIAVLPRPWGRLEWFLLGGTVGAVGLTLLLWHPALGQNYFVRTGWAFGAILSAMGVVSLVERRRVPARVVAAIVAGVVVASLSWSLLLWQASAAADHKGWRGLAPIWFAAATAAAVAGLAWAGFRLAGRRWPAMRGAAGVAALAVVMGAGLPDLVWDAHLYPNAVNYYHTLVTPDQAAAARWLRGHSAPDDVLATNVHCVQPSYDSCWLMSFRFSAFAERRVLVESWGYASRAVDEAATRSTTPAEIPFWNPDVLVTNEEAFYAPTPSTMDFLRRYGVRWLVVDREFGWESSDLRRLADVRWQHGTVVVYQLRPG